MSRSPRILTVQAVDWPDATVVALDGGLGGRLRRARALAAAALRHDLVLLSGAVSLSQLYDQMLIAGALARRHPQLCVVLDGCYWEAGTRFLDRLTGIRPVPGEDRPARRGRRLAEALVASVRRPNIHYVVYGSDERSVFAARWGIDRARVFHLNYHVHPWTERVDPGAVSAAGYVFAGGDSLRDYRPLLRAAERLACEIVIATRLPVGPTPSNVTAGPMAEHDFRAAALGAAVHVVPSTVDAPRSTGQATYLDALMLGIPAVVTDGLGVVDHLCAERDALIVAPGDADLLGSAIRRCLYDRALRERLRAAGIARARREYTLAAFRERQRRQLGEIWETHLDRLGQGAATTGATPW